MVMSMHVLEASILLIILIVLSNILSHYLVAIPTALIEISVGLVVALVFKVQIDLESDWFMLLFVAPLLFNDGKRFPKNELWELRAPIFANAILLVLLTTILGGFLIHLVISEIPFSLALALAAVLSPTDPVAVHGIAERVKLPKKILSLISGESLINDASGLIAFKYAMAAFFTSQFSLKNAALDFLYMSFVGAIIGFILINVFHYIRIFLVQQGIKDVILHTTIRILAPFVIFIVADEVAHASGVIAVVTAGVLSINQAPIFRGEFSEARMVTHKMWDMIIYILNGAVFVILGIELPLAMSETLVNPTIKNGRLILYTLIIWFILLIIRVLWSYSYLWMTYLRAKHNTQKPRFITALLTGLTGVRGAITLATIMSVSYSMPDGLPFVQRPLIIFLACGVILISLLVATVSLPILTKQRTRLLLTGDDQYENTDMPDKINLPINDTKDEKSITEIRARKLMIQSAIKVLQNSKDEAEKVVLSDLLHEFNIRLRHLYKEDDHNTDNDKYHQLEKEIQLIANEGEFTGINQVIENSQVSEKTAKYYLNFWEFKRQALTGGLRPNLKKAKYSIQRQLNHFLFRMKFVNSDSRIADSSLFLLREASAVGAIDSLKNYKKQLSSESKLYKVKLNIINQLLSDYRNQLERIRHISTHSRKEYELQLQKFYLKALDAERTTIQELFEEGKISLSLANRLRQSVNYSEISLLQNDE